MTLNKITASFNKTLKQLEKFIEKQNTAIGFAEDDIKSAENRREALKNDCARAERIKTKLEGIIE